MIKMLGKSWQRVVAVMLTVVLLATPAITGFAAANVSGLLSGKPGTGAFAAESSNDVPDFKALSEETGLRLTILKKSGKYF